MKEKLVKEEMENIDLNQLDQYPLFAGCDENADKLTRKACFETTLINHLKADLQQQFIVNEPVTDTIWAQFLIDNKGKILLLNIEKPNGSITTLSRLDKIFENSIATLPKLYPPLKQHIPVSAKFKLPIVIHVE